MRVLYVFLLCASTHHTRIMYSSRSLAVYAVHKMGIFRPILLGDCARAITRRAHTFVGIVDLNCLYMCPRCGSSTLFGWQLGRFVAAVFREFIMNVSKCAITRAFCNFFAKHACDTLRWLWVGNVVNHTFLVVVLVVLRKCDRASVTR